jgi:hypothetical protein
VLPPRRGTSCSSRGPCRLADIRRKHTNPIGLKYRLPQQRHLPFIGTRKSLRPFGRAPGRRRCPDFFAHSVVHRDTLLLREPAARGDGSRCPNSSRATSSDVRCPPRTPASHPTFPLLPSAGLRGSRLDGRCSGTSRPEFDEAGLVYSPSTGWPRAQWPLPWCYTCKLTPRDLMPRCTLPLIDADEEGDSVAFQAKLTGAGANDSTSRARARAERGRRPFKRRAQAPLTSHGAWNREPASPPPEASTLATVCHGLHCA